MPLHGTRLQKEACYLFQNFEIKSYELNEFNFIKIDHTSDIDVNNTINIHKMVEFNNIQDLLDGLIDDYEIVKTDEYMDELFDSLLKEPFYLDNIEEFHLYTFEEFNDLLFNSNYEIFHMDEYYVNEKPFLLMNDIMRYRDIVSYKINLYEKEVEKKKIENIVIMGVLIANIFAREEI